MNEGIPQDKMGIKKSNNDVIQAKESFFLKNSAISFDTVKENINVETYPTSKDIADDTLKISKIEEIYSNLHSTSYKLFNGLKDFQIKQLGTHILSQYESLLEYVKAKTEYASQERSPSDTQNRLLTSGLNSEEAKHMSTAALVRLIKNFNASDSSSQNLKAEVKLNIEEYCDIYTTAKTFYSSLRKLSSRIDADATESSSCDESSEDEKHSNTPKKSRPNSTWCLARERAAIAYRWIWLQAQIAHIEHLVRQRNEAIQELQKSKCHLVFKGLPYSLEMPSSQQNTLKPSNLISCDTLGSHHKPKTNGYIDFGKVLHPALIDPPLSRICPLQSYTKRRLWRVEDLPHMNNRKAARLSSLACGCRCQNIDISCINCNGRYNYTRSVDPDCMPFAERVAILDPSFHPVISTENDVDLSLHWEHMLKNDSYFKNLKVDLRKFRPLPNQSLLDAPNGFAKKFNKSRKHNKLKKRGPKRRRFTTDHDDDPEVRFSTVDGGGRQRRRAESDFDIDNVVIPSHSTGVAKAEPLQYKEIPTPKWRVKLLPPSDEPFNLEDIEDISDEAFEARHQKCEANEKLRFLYCRQTGRSTSGRRQFFGSMVPESSTTTKPPSSGHSTPSGFLEEEDSHDAHIGPSADWKCATWLNTSDPAADLADIDIDTTFNEHELKDLLRGLDDLDDDLGLQPPADSEEDEVA